MKNTTRRECSPKCERPAQSPAQAAWAHSPRSWPLAPGADWRPQCAGTEAGSPFPHPLPAVAQFSRLRQCRGSWSSRHGSVAGVTPGAGRGRGRRPGAGGGRRRHRLRTPQKPRPYRLLSHRPGEGQACARAEWRAVVPGPGSRDRSWGWRQAKRSQGLGRREGSLRPGRRRPRRTLGPLGTPRRPQPGSSGRPAAGRPPPPRQRQFVAALGCGSSLLSFRFRAAPSSNGR